MKIACLGNINADLPALEAILADAKRREVDLFVHAGNIIGHGPDIAATLQRLKGEKFHSILGREDARILKCKQKLAKVGTSAQPDKWMDLKARYDALSEEGRTVLKSFPARLRLRLELKTLLLLKENPFAQSGPPPHGPDPVYAEFRKQTKSDIIIWTEGGLPSAWKMGPVWFLNAGSMVGPAGPDQVCYTILQWKPGFFQVRHYQIPYHPGIARPLGQAAASDGPAHAAADFQSAPQDSGAAPLHAATFSAIQRLMHSCLGKDEIRTHSNQVTGLALQLFDGLQPLHSYGAAERLVLQCAALLHDIGWVAGQEGHHKTAFNIITNTGVLPFAKRERYIIGAVARYHRKSAPRPRHLYFATMEPADRTLVTILAALLRVADGLDRSHRSLIRDLHCLCSPAEIRLVCTAAAPEGGEVLAALAKGTLLEQTFGRKLVIEWQHPEQPPQAE